MPSTKKLYLKTFLFSVIPFGLALTLLNYMLDLGMGLIGVVFTTIIVGGFNLGVIAREKRKSDY